MIKDGDHSKQSKLRWMVQKLSLYSYSIDIVSFLVNQKGHCNTPKCALFELLAYAKVIKVQSFIRRRHQQTQTLKFKVVGILIVNMYLVCKNL
jgi:hypothetical protein